MQREIEGEMDILRKDSSAWKRFRVDLLSFRNSSARFCERSLTPILAAFLSRSLHSRGRNRLDLGYNPATALAALNRCAGAILVRSRDRDYPFRQRARTRGGL